MEDIRPELLVTEFLESLENGVLTLRASAPITVPPAAVAGLLAASSSMQAGVDGAEVSGTTQPLIEEGFAFPGQLSLILVLGRYGVQKCYRKAACAGRAEGPLNAKPQPFCSQSVENQIWQ
jgi:hypothetical protein